MTPPFSPPFLHIYTHTYTQTGIRQSQCCSYSYIYCKTLYFQRRLDTFSVCVTVLHLCGNNCGRSSNLNSLIPTSTWPGPKVNLQCQSETTYCWGVRNVYECLEDTFKCVLGGLYKYKIDIVQKLYSGVDSK